MPHLLLALDFYLTEPRRAVVAGDPGRPETTALLRAVHSVYQPDKVVLGNAGAVEPFAKTLPAEGAPQVSPLRRLRLPAPDQRPGETARKCCNLRRADDSGFTAPGKPGYPGYSSNTRV